MFLWQTDTCRQVSQTILYQTDCQPCRVSGWCLQGVPGGTPSPTEINHRDDPRVTTDWETNTSNVPPYWKYSSLAFTETKMSSFWWNFHHWLHWKLSFWQLSVQPVMKISSKWRHFRFSVKSIEMICHMNYTHWFVTYCRVVVELFINLLLHGIYFHHDVIKWKRFSRYWPFVWGNHRSPVNSHHKNQWRGALEFSLICAWTNGWVNNRNAGDLMTSPRSFWRHINGKSFNTQLLQNTTVDNHCA